MKTLDNLPAGIRLRLADIKLLLMDVDGVLTDGVIRIDDHGVESKRFHVRDGLGLYWVRKYGLTTGVVSGRPSLATEKRCQALKMDEIHLGKPHKLPVLQDILKRTGLPAEAVAYVGDDVIDLPVLSRVGVSAAPADAHPEVICRVDVVLDFPGGRGAVRHFIDLWLMAAGHWTSALEDMAHGKL